MLSLRSATGSQNFVSAQSDATGSSAVRLSQDPLDFRYRPHLGQAPISSRVRGSGPLDGVAEPPTQESIGVPLFPPEIHYSEAYESIPQEQGLFQQQYRFGQPYLQYTQQQQTATYSPHAIPEGFDATAFEAFSSFPAISYPTAAYQTTPKLQIRTGQSDQANTSASNSPASQVVNPTTFTTQMSLSSDARQPQNRNY
jgi:hypothetical protein